jgi:hypothetical protein
MKIQGRRRSNTTSMSMTSTMNMIKPKIKIQKPIIMEGPMSMIAKDEAITARKDRKSGVIFSLIWSLEDFC